MNTEDPSFASPEVVTQVLTLGRKISHLILASMTIHAEIAFPKGFGRAPDAEEPGNTPMDQASDHMTQATLASHLADIYRELASLTAKSLDCPDALIKAVVPRLLNSVLHVQGSLQGICERFMGARGELVIPLAMRGQVLTEMGRRLSQVVDAAPRVILVS